MARLEVSLPEPATRLAALETGEAQGEDDGRVVTYPARVENGRILLDRAFLRARVAA